MTRILYLVRHAQAEVARNQNDKTRRLTQTGETEAMQLGEFLKTKNIQPILIVSSTAERAHTTAKLIGEQLNFDLTKIETRTEIYAENLIEILKLINQLDTYYNSVLIVGHFPTIVELYNYLTENESIAAMGTAELRSLTFEVDWAQITAQSGRPGLFLQQEGL
jgi:phosphohistidine phosphatase